MVSAFESRLAAGLVIFAIVHAVVRLAAGPLRPGKHLGAEAHGLDPASKAVRCANYVTSLRRDQAELLTFFDFPAEHWKHIRTTNPIESTFSTVRHRTRQTKGCGSREATLMMVYKLGREAEKHWRCLDGYRLIIKVLHGVRFEDGEEQSEPRKAA